MPWVRTRMHVCVPPRFQLETKPLWQRHINPLKGNTLNPARVFWVFDLPLLERCSQTNFLWFSLQLLSLSNISAQGISVKSVGKRSPFLQVSGALGVHKRTISDPVGARSLPRSSPCALAFWVPASGPGVRQLRVPNFPSCEFTKLRLMTLNVITCSKQTWSDVGLQWIRVGFYTQRGILLFEQLMESALD